MIVEDSKKSLKVASKYYCYDCDYNTCKKNDYIKHLSTDKHKNTENGSKMVVNDSKKSPKVALKFICNLCDYSSSKKSDYVKHLTTDKHKNRQNGSKW